MRYYTMELTLHVFKTWFADTYTGPMMHFDRRVSTYEWRVVDFVMAIWSWRPKSKHRRNVSLSGKSGQTTASTSSENINLASRELICAQVILNNRHSPRFSAWVRICFQRLAAWERPTALRMTSFELLGKVRQRCAWRHLNCTWEFRNHRRECVR